MARKNVSYVAGTVYHLIARFVAKEWFIKTVWERHCYLQLLGRGLATTDWRCIGFAIMSNHIHLAVVAGKKKLAAWLGPAHSIFAEWMNERRGRIGSVFTRGPKRVAYTRAGVRRLLSYVHHNPVRARVARSPRDSEWTSHRMYSGDAEPAPWLDIELALELTGAESAQSLAAWIEANPTTRAGLEEMRIPTRGPGRPRKAHITTQLPVIAEANMRADG